MVDVPDQRLRPNRESCAPPNKGVHALLLNVPKLHRKYIELLRDNLEEITSPFVNQLSRTFNALTPTEVRICDMIRSGMQTKEIARIRGVSPATISRHREHIRRKLNIANDAINLTTFLQSASNPAPVARAVPAPAPCKKGACKENGDA